MDLRIWLAAVLGKKRSVASRKDTLLDGRDSRKLPLAQTTLGTRRSSLVSGKAASSCLKESAKPGIRAIMNEAVMRGVLQTGLRCLAMGWRRRRGNPGPVLHAE
jgi:hypothetical protein